MKKDIYWQLKKKEESLNLLINENFALAKKSANDKFYENAIACMNSILKFDTKNEKAKELLAQYKDAKDAIDTEEARIAEAEAQKREAEAKALAKTQGVRIGMTQQEVLDSNWGKPIDINRTITEYGTHEQWVYDNYNYLYFEDGILTSIQN